MGFFQLGPLSKYYKAIPIRFQQMIEGFASFMDSWFLYLESIMGEGSDDYSLIRFGL